MPKSLHALAVVLSILPASGSAQVSGEQVTPAMACRDWLLGTVKDTLDANDQTRAELRTVDEVRTRQSALRSYLRSVMPALPRANPAQAVTTGTLQRDGYSIEKVLIEAEPHHHVTALFYRPDPARFQSPWPGVVVACGHAQAAKAYPEYQRAGALLALHGLAALVFDPLDQGERIQVLDANGNQRWWGTTGHNISGGPALLLGTCQAAYQVRDGAVAIDFLQARPEIDGRKIGVMGNSGGGTQAALLMVMDDRIQCAAPACYITAFEELLTGIGPQDAEQFLPGQLTKGLDHAEFLWTRAPMPVLVCATEDDFFPIAGTRRTVEAASGIYDILGQSESLELAVAPGQHGWHQPLRERSVEWMCRWIDDRIIEVNEPEIELLTESESHVTPGGQVMKMAGELSIHDLLRNRLQEQLAKLDDAPRLLDTENEASDSLEQLKLPPGLGPIHVDNLPMVEHEVMDVSEDDGVLTARLNLTCTPSVDDESPRTWTIPVIRKRLAGSTPGMIRMIVRPAGVSETASTEQPTQSTELLLVDPRFCGESLQDEHTKWSPFYGRFGTDGQPAVLLMMLGRSLPGVQAEDLLAVATWANDGRPILLEAEGSPAMAARYAAWIAPDLFQELMVRDTPRSWKKFFEVGNANATTGPPLVQRQFSTIVPGVLPAYDLPPLEYERLDQP